MNANDYTAQELQGHDFSGAALDGAKFARAKLAKAKFRGAKLAKADFTGADLADTDFSGASLNGAVFIGSNLEQAILSHATLDDGTLEGARLQGVNLTGASLRRTNVENSGIETAHMPGANLSGARGSNVQERLEERLEIAKSHAERLRNVLIALFALCGYVGPTALLTKDALVLTNLSTMTLPVVDAEVSVHAFFLLSAILCVAMQSYLLSLVGHFARLVSRLPAQLPNGAPLREQVDPWVLGCIGVLRKPDLPLLGQSELGRATRGLFELLGEWLPSAVARWFGPLTLGILVYRFSVACRFDRSALLSNLSFALLLVLFLSSWTITFGATLYAELVDGVRPRASGRWHVLAAASVLALLIAPRLVSGRTVLLGAPDESLQGVQLAGARLVRWNLAGAKLKEGNLSNAQLAGAFLPEASLAGADLRHTLVERATFAGAELAEAKLILAEGSLANFWYANLRESDARDCSLPKAIFQNTDLSGSRLQKLKAPGAIATLANFSGAQLDDAVLDHAQLNGSKFKEATLFRASFGGADLGSSNFAGAQLFSAKLDGADLTDVIFSGAHLSTASLRGAFLLRTVLDAAEIWKPDLTGARLERVTFAASPNLAEASFRDARLEHVQLTHANLYMADFSGATLSDVTFDEASLQSAKFTGAHLEKVSFRNANLAGVIASPKDFSGVDLGLAKNLPSELTKP